MSRSVFLRRSFAAAVLAAGAALALAGCGSAPADAAVELKAVKLDQFLAAVAAQRGQVVVVDVWAQW